MADTGEKRKHPRIQRAYEYTIHIGDQTYTGMTREVSPYGIGIFSDVLLDANKKVDLEIYIPSDDFHIDTRGEIIYCARNPDLPSNPAKYLIGISFTEGTLEDYHLTETRKVVSRHTPAHSVTIDADANRCYRFLREFERYPYWADGVEEVRILERYPNGRGRRIEFKHDFFLRSIIYVLDYFYDDEKMVVSWQSAGGDDEIVDITGSYTFSPQERNRTLATYRLDVALSIIPAPRLVKFVSNVIMQKEMNNFKKFVEKNFR